MDVDLLIAALIEREGGYVNHPADRGGPTCYGITESVARAHGYGGGMRNLPQDRGGGNLPPPLLAAPRLRRGRRAQRGGCGAELFDTGVNMGPAVAATFLQRALTALNRNGGDYADLAPDGRIGKGTLAALDALPRGARKDRRRDRLAARARSSAGRALLAPRRAPPGQ